MPLGHHSDDWSITPENECESLLHYHDLLDAMTLQRMKLRERQVDLKHILIGLPWGLSWQRICLQCRGPAFSPWVGKIPWRREQLPTPVFRPGEFHGLYSPRGCKELDATEELSLYFLFSLPGGASGKGPTYQRRRHKRWGFDSWVWKISQGGFSNPRQCSCLENPMDKRSLAGYSL